MPTTHQTALEYRKPMGEAIRIISRAMVVVSDPYAWIHMNNACDHLAVQCDTIPAPYIPFDDELDEFSDVA